MRKAALTVLVLIFEGAIMSRLDGLVQAFADSPMFPWYLAIMAATIVLLYLPEIRDYFSVYRRGIRDSEKRKRQVEKRKQNVIQRLAKRISRKPYHGKPRYDPSTDTLVGVLRIRRAWKNRAMDYAVWCVNRRILPERFLRWIAPKLGYKFRNIFNKMRQNS